MEAACERGGAEKFAKSRRIEKVPIGEKTTVDLIEGLGDTGKMSMKEQLVLEDKKSVPRKVPIPKAVEDEEIVDEEVKLATKGKAKVSKQPIDDDETRKIIKDTTKEFGKTDMDAVRKREEQGIKLKKLMDEERARKRESARTNLKEKVGLTDEQIGTLSEKEISLMNSGIYVLEKADEGKDNKGGLMGDIEGMPFEKMRKRLVYFARYDGSDPIAGKMSFKKASEKIGEWVEADRPDGKIPKAVEDEEIVDEEVKLATVTEKAKIREKPKMPKIKVPKAVEDEEIVDEEVKLATKGKAKIEPKLEKKPLETTKETVAEKEGTVDVNALLEYELRKQNVDEEKFLGIMRTGLAIVESVDESGELARKLGKICKTDPGKAIAKLEHFAKEFGSPENADAEIINYLVMQW
ncbi:MAG: hypothetical protein ABIG39_07615 [Candidatus Micrarchaeota archaeon]